MRGSTTDEMGCGGEGEKHLGPLKAASTDEKNKTSQ